MTVDSTDFPSGGQIDRCRLAELAGCVAARLPSDEMQILTALGAGSRPDADALAAALLAIRRSLPFASLAGLNAARALVRMAQLTPGIPDPLLSAALLTLAWIHTLRREGRAAATVLDGLAGRRQALPPELQARWLLAESQVAVADGRYQDALRCLERGRDGYARLGDRMGQAEACLELSQLRSDQGRFAAAQDLAGEAASLAADDPWLSCRARLQSLDVRYYHSHFVQAASGYEALAAECQAAGWQMDDAHVSVMQGLIATQQGRLLDAREHLLAATARYQAEEAAYYLGVCHRAMAMVWRRQGNFPDAAAEAQAALVAFDGLDHLPGIGRCHQALGIIYQDWNDYGTALTEHERALAILESIGLRVDPMVIRLNQAEILVERGYLHAALAHYEQALQASLALRVDHTAAHCLLNMAMLNSRLGSYPEAIALYRRARHRFSRLHVTLEAQLCAARQASLLDLMGESRRAQRLLSAARRHFASGGHEMPLAFSDLIAGEIAARNRRHRTALSHFDAALHYFEAHGHELDAALSRLLLGQTYLAAGDAARAVSLLEDAAVRFADGLPDQAARAEHALGQAIAALGEPARAVGHHQAAVSHLTRARRGIMTESQAGQYVASREPIYEDALAACLAVDDARGALTVVEAAKGQVLVSLLQHREVMHAAFAGQSSEVRQLWEELWQVSRQLDGLRGRWGEANGEALAGTRGLLASDALSRPHGQVTDQIGAVAARQSEIFDRIRRAVMGFDFLNLPEDFSPEQLRATAASALGTGWGALAYYYPAPDCLLIVWITGKIIRAWERRLTPLMQARLADACSPDLQQRELVYAGSLRGLPQPCPPGPQLMRSLGSLLIPDEVQSGLAAGRPLLISPHGRLHYLPFHALLLADGRPLVDRAIVTYAPTLQVWEALARRNCAVDAPPPPGIPDPQTDRSATPDAGRRSEQAGEACDWRQALVFGISDFGDAAPGLPHAEGEARTVARQLRRHGVGAVECIGREAALDSLQTWNEDGALCRFDILHLATHAVYEGRAPLLSRILLAGGSLAVPDIFRLRLDARLVTLSACQTALSSLYPGDELLGLREALLFAGARSLLVSLWQVDDESTETFMREFYACLLAGRTPAHALAEAQRRLRSLGATPYQWAPFVLIG